jgi:hypothetical protein
MPAIPGMAAAILMASQNSTNLELTAKRIIRRDYGIVTIAVKFTVLIAFNLLAGTNAVLTNPEFHARSVTAWTTRGFA